MFCLLCPATRSLTTLLCFFKSHALFELYQASRHINCKASLDGEKADHIFYGSQAMHTINLKAGRVCANMANI